MARLPSAAHAHAVAPPKTLEIVELAPQQMTIKQVAPVRLTTDMVASSPRRRVATMQCVVDPFCIFP